LACNAIRGETSAAEGLSGIALHAGGRALLASNIGHISGPLALFGLRFSEPVKMSVVSPNGEFDVAAVVTNHAFA
jgi:hypothetical protein